jgi:hypothetical protein
MGVVQDTTYGLTPFGALFVCAKIGSAVATVSNPISANPCNPCLDFMIYVWRNWQARRIPPQKGHNFAGKNCLQTCQSFV